MRKFIDTPLYHSEKLVILELPMLFLNIQPKPTFQVFRKNDILLTYCGSQSTLCRRLSEAPEDYKSLELKAVDNAMIGPILKKEIVESCPCIMEILRELQPPLSLLFPASPPFICHQRKISRKGFLHQLPALLRFCCLPYS